MYIQGCVSIGCGREQAEICVGFAFSYNIYIYRRIRDHSRVFSQLVLFYFIFFLCTFFCSISLFLPRFLFVSVRIYYGGYSCRGTVGGHCVYIYSVLLDPTLIQIYFNNQRVFESEKNGGCEKITIRFFIYF